MINAKKKGNKNENDFANWLQENGIKAWRNSSSGAGLYKGDINNSLDLTIECKSVANLNVQDAWKQVKRDSETAHNTPVLAIHYNGFPEKTWLIVMHSEEWLEWLKKVKEI